MRTLSTLTLLFGLVAAAQAGTVLTVNFTSPVQAGGPGSTLSFYATITNNNLTDTEYINTENVSLDPTLTVDDSMFYSNFFSVGPGATTSPAMLAFTVTIPVSEPLGPYAGTLHLFGGADGGTLSAGDNLDEAAFTVKVVPEPTTTLALGGGLLALFWRGRKRRSAN